MEACTTSEISSTNITNHSGKKVAKKMGNRVIYLETHCVEDAIYTKYGMPTKQQKNVLTKVTYPRSEYRQLLG